MVEQMPKEANAKRNFQMAEHSFSANGAGSL
jgi:hypothetical protein